MPQGSDFFHQWSLLQEQAREVIAESPSNPAHVQLMLNRLTALLFGLDESLKQKATNALDLIVQLVHCSSIAVVPATTSSTTATTTTTGTSKSTTINTDPPVAASEPISLAALKAIKSCVIRNPVGRNSCRAAGVFPFLQSTLVHHAQDPILIEEAMTTLAAMCLSNDLNALQVSV
jgi:hypothetical protein